MEWSEGGGKWDNCNSIINKYIFFKKRFSIIGKQRLRLPARHAYSKRWPCRPKPCWRPCGKHRQGGKA